VPEADGGNAEAERQTIGEIADDAVLDVVVARSFAEARVVRVDEEGRRCGGEFVSLSMEAECV